MVKIKLRVRMDRSIKFMILDDSEVIRKTEIKILQALGFKGPFIQVGSLREAEKAISTHDIQYFILDWNLPDGTGLNFLKSLRKIDKYKNTPVLMVTTEDEVGKMLEAIEEGASNYSTKPIEIEDFVEKFQGAYEKHYGSEKKTSANADATKTRTVRLKSKQQTEISSGTKVPLDSSFLLVDDSPTQLVATETALKGLGYKGRIHKAESVGQAKKILEKQSVSFILCDWNMPGQTGIDFLKFLKSDNRYKKLPFIMITAESDSAHILQAVEAGVTEYLTKPWTPDKIKEKIEASWEKNNAKVYKMGR